MIKLYIFRNCWVQEFMNWFLFRVTERGEIRLYEKHKEQDH